MSSSCSEERSLNEDGDNISVVLRIRPLNSTEINRKDTNVITFPESGSITINQSGSLRAFTFDTVFGPEANQEVVFEQSKMQHLVEMAIEGYTSMAMAFGQTGSGKTHTMTGPPSDVNSQIESAECNDMGIVQRSFGYLFERLAKRTQKATVKASYLEIYNEQVIDLLNPQPWRNLMIRWSKRKGFYVENLFQLQCEYVEDLIALLDDGRKKRHIGCSSANEWSSRSHSILTLTISEEVLQDTNPDIYLTRRGKLVFVDLAGSEKVRDGCVAEETLIESNNINKSLLVLEFRHSAKKTIRNKLAKTFCKNSQNMRRFLQFININNLTQKTDEDSCPKVSLNINNNSSQSLSQKEEKDVDSPQKIH